MVKISICQGSACRMNGAEDTPALFKKALSQYYLEDQVAITEGFCMGECMNGPCVRIDGVKFRHVDQDRVASLIEEEVLPRIKA